MRDPLSRNFWPIDFFFSSSFSLVRSSSLFFFFFFSLGSGCWVLGKKKKKNGCTLTGVEPLNSLKNSEWWKPSDGTKQPWYLEWWVMSDENWVMNDERWKLSDQKKWTKEALNYCFKTTRDWAMGLLKYQLV